MKVVNLFLYRDYYWAFCKRWTSFIAKHIRLVNSIKPDHLVYIAICLVIVGLTLVITHKKSPVDVFTQETQNAQVTVLDLSNARQKDDTRLYLGMGLMGIGLLIGATNLRVRKEESTGQSSIGLTLKEQEVLGCIENGLSNKEIAQQLYISPSTVKTHVGNIYKKYQVNSRAGLLSKLL